VQLPSSLEKATTLEEPNLQLFQKFDYPAAEALDSQKLRREDLSPPAIASSNLVDRFTRASSVIKL
jgi:hypothetical protein